MADNQSLSSLFKDPTMEDLPNGLTTLLRTAEKTTHCTVSLRHFRAFSIAIKICDATGELKFAAKICSCDLA